jgi:TetR/AcrR family transcriptional regulator, fatty acid metabolism regulator protein
VECAFEVVAEIGYARTSIRKIAERVGVAMSVVLYHFANKDELVRTIATEAYRSTLAKMVPALEAETTAAGKLRAYIRSHAACIKSNRTQFMAVLDIAMSYRSPTGERLDQLELGPQLAEDLVRLDLEAILRRGQEAGEFRPMDTRSVAMALRGALDNAVVEIARDPDYDVLRYAEELVTVFDLTKRGT